MSGASDDPPADGWIVGMWWRVVLSDGSVWSESSNEAEVRAALAKVRTERVRVFPPGFTDGIVYGPDAGAKLQRIHHRTQLEWRDA